MFKTTTTQLKRLFACVAIGALSATAHAGGGSIVLTPADSIQDAIDSGYAMVILAPGTYTENITVGTAGTHLRSTDPENPDVMNATILTSATFGTSIVTLNGTIGMKISGVTITGGRTQGAAPNDRGAGINMPSGGSLILAFCYMYYNDATYGGSVYGSNASVTIRSSRISDCWASSGGGAYFNQCNVIVENVSFDINRAVAGDGGAIRTDLGSAGVYDCRFIENDATLSGGAVYARGSIAAERCMFRENAAINGGGLFLRGSIYQSAINSVFDRNIASGSGGGLYCDSSAVVRHCTFNANTGEFGSLHFGANATTAYIDSCIAWGTSTSQIGPWSSGNMVTWTMVRGGYTGEGTLDFDPLFVDAANGDLRLSPGSYAIDTGNTLNLVALYPIDIEGNSRVVDIPDVQNNGLAFGNLAIDRGAYEFRPYVAPVCSGDVTDDGVIDFDDLLATLAAWGPCP